MDTDIDIADLHYAELLQLGKLAAEALALSQQYDRSRLHIYCELVARCNVEMLIRRRRAAHQCGRASLTRPSESAG